MTLANQSQTNSPSSVQSDCDRFHEDMLQHLARLREQVRHLEEQRERDQKKIAELQLDREALYAIVNKLFRDEDLVITPEELQDLMAGKDVLRLEAFIDDLKRIAEGP